jgi:hypothetical protein
MPYSTVPDNGTGGFNPDKQGVTASEIWFEAVTSNKKSSQKFTK